MEARGAATLAFGQPLSGWRAPRLPGAYPALLVSALAVALVASAGGAWVRPSTVEHAVAGDPAPASVPSVQRATAVGVPPRAALTARAPLPRTTAPLATATVSLAHLIGQKLVVAMSGTTPSTDLLGRIRRGEVGGVILMGSNITTKTALIALTKKLRAAATLGGQPRLLIATDQEGGSVKRIPWAPPTVSPPQMGRIGSTILARSQGSATGSALRGLGIDVDFAPVADVPASTASFMYRQGRTWSFSAKNTALLSDAFATGLESTHVAPSMKHFPGIGYATRNTDTNVVTITQSRTALAPGLKPYRTAIGHHLPLVMLSNATYPAYDRSNAAGWSHAIGTTLLRTTLGFRGVTITDSLDGTASARGIATSVLATKAVRAGTDMILTTGSEAKTRAIFAALLKLAQAGSISRSTLAASYTRILVLKAAF
jgi:beta-N-acetylhexosaminidase